MPFSPNYTISPQLAASLMEIERIRNHVEILPVTPGVLKTLRETARLLSTHYSTRIEGNRLTEDEIRGVLGGRSHFSGRERDEGEVKGYYLALEWMEGRIDQPITEKTIQKIHALAMGCGRKNPRPTVYREGQNVIRDSASGRIVYLPPEARDVPLLMTELLCWLKENRTKIPCPLLAALAHYQFATIHPYYDGNGRVARLLTSLILHQGGYGLKGIYSLEEYYAKDLGAYYGALAAHEHHNYYMGREKADISKWASYFIHGMQDAFQKVEKRAMEAADAGVPDQSPALSRLSARQRKILLLFENQESITARDVEELFSFSARSARALCQKLVEEGMLVIFDPAKKSRRYRLDERYGKMFGQREMS